MREVMERSTKSIDVIVVVGWRQGWRDEMRAVGGNQEAGNKSV
jgi:hypothetical protein